MKTWLCITNPYNWKIVKENGTWGVDDRYEITIRNNCNENDVLVFYVLKNIKPAVRMLIENMNFDIHDLENIEQSKGCFVGIYRIVGDYQHSNEQLGWINRKGETTTFPHRRAIELDIEPIHPIPLNPTTDLFNDLYFIADKSRSWYSLLYASMVLISDNDLAVFRNICN